jgi:hypothetical protein
LLKTLHTEVCQTDSFDAATKETERKKYEEGVYPLRDLASAPRVRMKRWQDEKGSPKPLDE